MELFFSNLGVVLPDVSFFSAYFLTTGVVPVAGLVVGFFVVVAGFIIYQNACVCWFASLKI